MPDVPSDLPRDFTALWIGATVSELGSRITSFAMPLVAYAITGSAAWAAAAEALYLVGVVGALLPAGLLADRVNRLRLMQLSLSTGVVLYLSLVLAGLAGSLTLPHLLSVAVITGVATGLFGPAEHAAVREIVAPAQLPRALSQQQARHHIASLLGGPIGGALFGLARWAPFAADVVSYAVGWALLRRVETDLSPAARPAAETAQRARPVHDIATGLSFIGQHSFLRVVLVWSPLTNLVVNALLFAAILRLIDGGFPSWQIGLTEAAIGACGILGALAATRMIERTPTGLLSVAVAWSWVPLAVPLALWNHPVAVAAAASVGIFLNPAGNAGIGAYRTAITPLELVGRVHSAMQFASMLTMPIAPLLAGALLAGTDGQVTMITLGALAAIVALIPTLSPSVRRVPKPAEWLADTAAPRVDEPATPA